MKSSLLALVLFIMPVYAGLQAQTKNAQEYKRNSEEIRKEVWAWDLPQFDIKEIPAKYANASKVIIARHTELTAASKSKVKFRGLSFDVNREQTLTEIAREKVKLNDKSAVSEYSELSFMQFKRTSGFYASDRILSYLGIRVVKPDGSVREIDADDVVLTRDDAAEKRAKVAIPDLQPGDIIDYFIATEQRFTNDFDSKSYLITLFDEAPVLSLSFHAQLGKKYNIEYRGYNGAPELQVDKSDEKDIIADVVKKDITPFETQLWVSPELQLPFIRMNITLGFNGMGKKASGPFAKQAGLISKNTDSYQFFKEKVSGFYTTYHQNFDLKINRKWYNEVVSDAKRLLKQSGISFDELSDEEKAFQLYYTLRYTRMLNFTINDLSDKINIGKIRFNGLTFPLFGVFRVADLDPAILITTPRTGFRLNEILSTGDLSSVTYLPNKKEFFTIQSIFDVPGVAPADLEGAPAGKSIRFGKSDGEWAGKNSGFDDLPDGIKIRPTAAGQNAHIENLKLSLSTGDNNLLVNRSTTLKGFYKRDAQSNLILYEDLYEEERKAFNDKQTLLEDLDDGKKSKKYADEVRNAFADARKKQKDAFTEEARVWFEQDITDLHDYKIDNMGIRHTAPDFVYSSKFSLDGLVKKAGNNIIVEIGRIQGSPLTIKEEQRMRKLDIYMPFARSIEYNMEIAIPEGYTAEGVAELNKTVRNETGFFTAETRVEDQSVIIKIKKHYLNNFESAGNWDKLIAFTDAANEWTDSKILFRKK